LAVTGKERFDLLPDVPAVNELAFAGAFQAQMTPSGSNPGRKGA
jgi:hypothetical protein